MYRTYYNYSPNSSRVMILQVLKIFALFLISFLFCMYMHPYNYPKYSSLLVRCTCFCFSPNKVINLTTSKNLLLVFKINTQMSMVFCSSAVAWHLIKLRVNRFITYLCFTSCEVCLLLFQPTPQKYDFGYIVFEYELALVCIKSSRYHLVSH